MKKNNYFLLIPLITLLLIISSCTYLQKQLDIMGLRNMAKNIEVNFEPGSPESLKSLMANFSLEEKTSPIHLQEFEVLPLERWKVKHPLGKNLIMEKITFPSLIRHKNNSDTAIFYVYRSGEMKGRNVILWVPGIGVSDFAFRFIKRFFFEELERDYDIVFYVPPFHLERIMEGEKNSVGFFTANTGNNLDTILNSVREIRTIAEYLHLKGVKSIGGWGGSVGASILLLASQIIDLDHLCIMIPIIDWEGLALENVTMQETIARLRGAGFTDLLLRKAYASISPTHYGLTIDPERVHIMYAQYDQLTHSDTILGYAEKNRITKITSYKRSHATILLSSRLYEDYGSFLDSLD